MPFILYHTNPCGHTPAIRRLVEALGVPCDFRVETAEMLGSIEGAVYRSSPILVADGVVVEDWRLIMRHLDEELGDGKLTALPPQLRAELFELCDEIDREIIRPAARFLIPAPASPGRSILAPLLGSKRLNGADSEAARAAVLAAAKRIAEDGRLKQPDFALAKLLFDGAIEFIRNDSNFSTKLYL